MERKKYDTKCIREICFTDYWNLKSFPLYVKLEKKQRPYFIAKELPAKGYEKINSLQSLTNYINKFDWSFKIKYWQSISRNIQAAIEIPNNKL